ncbi:MAG: hypothetical protein ONA90_11220, partial [candidate division KSB1 bacterium]|nr:hypothetical protein [candidate division KSB1 bacterium]
MLICALHSMRRLRNADNLPNLIRTLWVLSILLLFAAPSVFGQGSLTNVTVTPSDTTAGAGTVYTIGLTTSATGNGSVTGIPASGKIRLTFPAGFVVSTVLLANNVSGMTGGYLQPAVSGQVVTLTRDNTGNNLSASTAAVFNLAVVGNATVSGNYTVFVETLTGADALIDTARSSAFRIGPGTASRFTLSNIGTLLAGNPFTFTITAKDVHNNTVPTFTGPVNLSDNTGTLTPLSATIVSNGAVTVSNAKITKAMTGVRITAISGSVNGASNDFTVNPNVLHHFAVTNSGGGNIASQVAGAPFTIRIAAQDTFNNVVTSFTSSVTLSNTTNSINPINSGNFTSGTITLPVTILRATNADRITVSGGSPIRTGVSNDFVVTAGNLAGFQIAPISSPQTAGVQFPLIVTAIDANGNTVTSFVGTVNIALNSGNIIPTVSTNFVNGVWNGTVMVLTSGLNKTITVSSGSFISPSNPFNVNAGPATVFAVTNASDGNIGNQIAGTNFSVKITAKDASGNIATGFTGTVTLSDNTGTLTPTTAVISSNGTVTVSNANITKAQTNVSITAVSGSVIGASNNFNISHGGLDHFAVIDPSGGTIGAKIAGASFNIKLVAQDAFNNTVISHTGAGSAVTISNTTTSISPTSSGNFNNGEIPSLAVTIAKT